MIFTFSYASSQVSTRWWQDETDQEAQSQTGKTTHIKTITQGAEICALYEAHNMFCQTLTISGINQHA